MPTFYAPGTRKNNRHWTARGFIAGRQYEPSFPKAGNRRDAEDAWTRFKAGILGNREQSGECQEAPGPLTFAEAAAEYRTTSNPKGTQLDALEKVEHMFATHPDLKDLTLHEIGNRAAHICGDALYSGRSGAHKNRMVLTPIKAVLKACEVDHEEDYRAPRIRRYKETRTASRPAGEGDLPALIQAAGDDHAKRTFLRILYHQGFRHTETLAIRWVEDGKAPFVDLPAQGYWFYSSKADGWKFIPMAMAVFDELANWPADDRKGRVFKRWANRSSTRKWLVKLCDDLKIRFTPHMARHRYAKDRNLDGATRDDIAASSSWFDTRSLDRYIEVDEERARQVVNRGTERETGEGAKGKAAK